MPGLGMCREGRQLAAVTVARELLELPRLRSGPALPCFGLRTGRQGLAGRHASRSGPHWHARIRQSGANERMTPASAVSLPIRPGRRAGELWIGSLTSQPILTKPGD